MDKNKVKENCVSASLNSKNIFETTQKAVNTAIYAIRWLWLLPCIVSDSNHFSHVFTSFFDTIKTSRLRGPQLHHGTLFCVSTRTWVSHSYSGRALAPQSFSLFRLSTTSRSITLYALKATLEYHYTPFTKKMQAFAHNLGIFFLFHPKMMVWDLFLSAQWLILLHCLSLCV